ncbi:hypothetical protein CVD25_17315 [Bacillus canaveralius]|uniref:Uncharacterized protein n=1 Tax=Bacillus canaveralius TaxID=1403243 RepID=A0A2N5GSX5_9BACI|nr:MULTISPECIES: hypothetical protein [Bacillus]PLR83612.1 hypothetical protein CVD23_14030 [Bacillus sp. V33-4]PLR86871.1 hypothetical protein CU635_00855 [Bacillus canaveralius]PLR93359.1 hypothetical protein CVD25_17315 [Bacillus canaveralius]RSK50420.1 hypothetical protein EJA13_15110 [Bacillus canaveralius]
MQHINLEELRRFVSVPVAVGIQDDQGDEKAPFIRKTIQKIEICPDETHLRIYFDSFHFFAVPLTANVIQTEQEWSAFDRESGLYYLLKKGV